MRYTILSIAYPFAPVSADAAGGAEQILSTLDAALTNGGHCSIVIGCEGSRICGTLLATPAPTTDGRSMDEAVMSKCRKACREATKKALERWPIDIIHMHGLDFDRYLPPDGPPVLATLHLPIAWYSEAALQPSRPNTWLNCVSPAQRRAAASNPCLLATIENGIDVESFAIDRERRQVALMLTRICPEKGVHLAIEAAKQADFPLLIAGEVFPYAEHRRYFETEILTRLDAARRYIGPVGACGKRRLLASARCLLIPSLADETSSLVAREAAAAGTPVIAFARGALLDTVLDGVTGFLVANVAEMAAAISKAATISNAACRTVARCRFSQDRMIAGYLGLYRKLTAGGILPLHRAAS